MSQSALAGQKFTILHTNDWQSRVLGFGPNSEYTPASINDDETIGGMARLAASLSKDVQKPPKKVRSWF